MKMLKVYELALMTADSESAGKTGPENASQDYYTLITCRVVARKN